MASRLPVEAPEGAAARPSTPDSSSTSASTVGLPRESRISLAITSTIALIVVPVVAVKSFIELVLCEPALLDHGVERLERFEQRLHQLERPGVGPVRQRLCG